MASVASFPLCLFMGLLISASGLTGFDLLPSWLAAPLLRLKNENDSALLAEDAPAEVAGPEAVLMQRLAKIDAASDPKTANALHAAIGNILRATGTSSHKAIQHFEAARDAAALGADQDTLLTAHLDLADAYVEEGRALDSQRELAVASGVLADHFVEHRSKLNRGRGRAKFELGFTDRALEYFLEAEQTAVQPDDKVLVACDIAVVHTCLGKVSEALKPLQQALDVLHADRKAGPDGGMPALVHTALAADVHFRLAEAYHSSQNAVFAKAHYDKALHLMHKSVNPKQQRITAIKRGIKYLDRGIAPELRCPPRPGSKLPWNAKQASAPDMKDPKLMTKIDLLMEEKRFDVVETELKATLGGESRPYKSPGAALALNMLGDLYRKQNSFAKAAKHFRQALHAAIVCCGATNPDAQRAYEGLRDVKAELSFDDQRVAAAAISRFFDVLEVAGRSAKATGEKEQESTIV